MTNVVSAFTFQHATGSILASKGIGRSLYEIASVVDRSRNEVVDRLQMSGKVLVQGDENALNSLEMQVFGQNRLRVIPSTTRPSARSLSATWASGVGEPNFVPLV